MARWTKYLTNLLPRTGRMIKEDGEAVNEADVLANVIVGDNAFVVQPYTEVNVKRGLEYYVRVAYPLGNEIPGGESRRIFFQTTTKPVLVKLRDFEYVGEELQIEIFIGPSGVTGGSNVTINNWNGVNPVPTTASCIRDVTTTDDGTPIESEPEYFFGGALAFNRDSNSIPQGRERVLPANSDFLVVITNNSTGAARCQYFLDWYEGSADIS